MDFDHDPPSAPFQKEINQQVTQLLADSLWFQDGLWPTLKREIPHMEVTRVVLPNI
jgi:hypothetical protein